MHYWTFRLAIYQQHLEAWLNSIKQAAAGLVYLFPMALPALFLLPLLALGILADADTPTNQFGLTLWGFLLLTHSWVVLQKDGILATPNKYYDASLPVSAPHRFFITLLVTLYAAHIFIAGPVLLFLFMALGNIEQLVSQPFTESLYQLFPIAAVSLLAVLVIVLALYRRYPLFSLILAPLMLMPAMSVFSTPVLVGSWTVLLITEQILPPVKLRIRWLPAGMLRLFITADIASPNKGMLRLISLLILLICAQVFMQSVAPEASNAAGYLFSFIVGILLASKLIDTLGVKAQYQHYLNTLPVSIPQQTAMAVAYSTLYCIPLLATVAWFATFHFAHWYVLAAIFTATKAGILLNRKYFLVFPCCTALGLWWVM